MVSIQRLAGLPYPLFFDSALTHPDLGRYSFREWSALWTPGQAGDYRLRVRAFNRIGESQDYEPLWTPAGYLRNSIEHIDVHAA